MHPFRKTWGGGFFGVPLCYGGNQSKTTTFLGRGWGGPLNNTPTSTDSGLVDIANTCSF